MIDFGITVTINIMSNPINNTSISTSTSSNCVTSPVRRIPRLPPSLKLQLVKKAATASAASEASAEAKLTCNQAYHLSGTSGYNYDFWMSSQFKLNIESFYPHHIGKKQMFSHYASVFNFVEI